MDIDKMATGLIWSEEGFWQSKSRENISYPDQGNSVCHDLENDSFWFRHRNNCVLQVIKNFPPRGEILDVGGGNGMVALALQQAGWRVCLLEPGKRGIKNARARGVRHIIWSTLDGAGFRPSAISSAGLFDVLEHIPNDEALLQELYIYLKPGGRLFLTVPAYQRLWSQEDVWAGHHRRYAKSQLVEKLKAAGFLVEYATYFFFGFPLPIYLLRTLPDSMGIFKKRNNKAIPQFHKWPRPLEAVFEMSLFKQELLALADQKVIPFGSSCLAVARKEANAGHSGQK